MGIVGSDMRAPAPIILALDTHDQRQARTWIEQTRDVISIYKIGLEYFLSCGKADVMKLTEEFGCEIFLDLKLHDIPNTVRGAVRSIAEISPRFLTVHASGGGAMIEAAAHELPSVEITAVTILTSLNEHDVDEIGFADKPLPSALKLAQLAVIHGARALVCSPHEVAQIRKIVPSHISLITPGVRPTGSSIGDQQRTMTPQQALDAGADFLVIGRPITGAQSPSRAAADIATELEMKRFN